MKQFNQAVETETQAVEVVKTSGPKEIEEGYFQPLQVIVHHNFDRAMKAFRSLVQADQILAEYKRRQTYEKPSEKKRRKRSESIQRVYEEEMKMQKILSGEYDKEKARKQVKKEQKMRERAIKSSDKSE